MRALRIIFCLSVALPLAAGCLPVEGDRIRAEDLAVVVPLFSGAAGKTISPVPLAGAERRFSRGELRRLALRLGLSDSEAAEWPAAVCFAYRLAPLTRDQVITAIAGSPGGAGRFELTEHSLFPVPSGKLVFRNVNFRPDRRDGTKLLLGVVMYAPGRQTPVWARVRPVIKLRGLVATEELRPGLRLDKTHVRVSELDSSVISALADPTEIEGLTPRRRIGAGTPLNGNMLTRALEVGPGETVQVKVRSGSASLSFSSRAETGGYSGDRILLRNPASGQRFPAKVVGRAQVSIDLPSKEN